MNPSRRLLLAAILGLAAQLTGQLPAVPPSWWNTVDNDTVSLGYTFDTDAWPPVANTTTAPVWFTGATWTKSPNVTWMANLTSHTGVWGLTGLVAELGEIEGEIDNDPRVEWIKFFFVEYEAYFTGTDTVGDAMVAPVGHGLHNLQRTVEDIGDGWYRITLESKVIPQPDDEVIEFDFSVAGLGTPVAVDNVYVGTRCIPKGSDPGTSSGTVGSPTGKLADLGAVLGNTECMGVAYTDHLGQERFWVAARSPIEAPFQPHKLYELDADTCALLATHDQPTTWGSPSTSGIRDLAVDPTGPSIFGLIEDDTGGWEMQCFDVATGSWDPAPVAAPFLPGGAVVSALAFNPDGNIGQGSFWTVDRNTGTAYEFDRSGSLLGSTPGGAPMVFGAGYDRVHGRVLWFGRDPDPSKIQVVGTEFDVASKTVTGVQFYGDLGVPLPGPGTEGGEAIAMMAYRPQHGELKLVCLADAQTTDFLYTLHGQFQFGHSCIGSIGMAGAAFIGNASWELSLEGVEGAVQAGLYLGFSNQMFLGEVLPYDLIGFGMPNCAVLVSLEALGPIHGVTGNRVVQPVAIPNAINLKGVEIYLQWAVYKPGLNVHGIGLSDAGAVMIY